MKAELFSFGGGILPSNQNDNCGDNGSQKDKTAKYSQSNNATCEEKKIIKINENNLEKLKKS